MTLKGNWVGGIALYRGCHMVHVWRAHWDMERGNSDIRRKIWRNSCFLHAIDVFITRSWETR
jgi:hypothetical protein